MSAVVVVARLMPHEGLLEELITLLGDLAPQIHAEEPGCLLYAVHRPREDGGPVMMVEKFASIEAFELHGASKTLAAYQPRLAELLSSPVEVTVLDPVAFGDPAKRAISN